METVLDFNALERLVDGYLESKDMVGYIHDVKLDTFLEELHQDDSFHSRVEDVLFNEIKDLISKEIDYETQDRTRELKAELFGQDIKKLEKRACVFTGEHVTIGKVYYRDNIFRKGTTEIDELTYLNALHRVMDKEEN